MFMMVKKARTQMEAYVFDLSDTIYIIGFLATFKLIRNDNNFQGGAFI